MALRAGPLDILLLLVARRDIVAGRVAQNALRGLRGAHVLARPGDHDRELTLEMHRIGVGRQLDGHVRADDRGVGFHEHHRIGEVAAAPLLDVCRVVLSDAHHLAGQNRSQQSHVSQWPLPAGEVRRPEGMLGDFFRDCFARVIRRPFDADEGDPSGLAIRPRRIASA